MQRKLNTHSCLIIRMQDKIKVSNKFFENVAELKCLGLKVKIQNWIY